MSKRNAPPRAAATRPDTPVVEREPGVLVRCVAEAIGTFVLVLGGCGAAVLAATAQNPDGVEVGIGYLGVALAFGLAVMAAIVAIGGISGGHVNPAVTIGAALTGRLDKRLVLPYVASQIVGATVGGAVLWAIASSRPGFDAVTSGFASNGFGDRSPGGYGLAAALLAEIVLTAVFVLVVLSVTTPERQVPWAPVAVGLTLTLIHLIGIPVTNTSVNPARSLGVAWFAGPAALGQVWVFLLAPVVGGALAAVTYRLLHRGSARPAA